MFGEKEMHIGYLWRNVKGRDHLKDLYKDGKKSRSYRNRMEGHGLN